MARVALTLVQDAKVTECTCLDRGRREGAGVDASFLSSQWCLRLAPRGRPVDTRLRQSRACWIIHELRTVGATAPES